MNIRKTKERSCVRSLIYIRKVVSRFCSFLWKSVYGSSRQLALGTWKSSCQETDWGRRCGMVTLPGCRHTADQAPLSLSCQKKDHVLKLPHSQGNWYPQPHSETKWLPGSPTSLFLTIRQIIRCLFFPFLSVNVKSTIASLRLQSSQVCVRERVCFSLGVSCGAVNL